MAKKKYNEYHNNPRKIKKKQLDDLDENLRLLGDLSCIVYDLNSSELISGNQRSKVINIENCEIVITERYEPATEQGTVAIGYVVWEGQKLNYREVRWTAEQCERANITANKLGGTWDFEILNQKFDRENLKQFGFEDFELPVIAPTKEDSEYKEGDFDGEGGEKEEKKVECTCPKCGFVWQK
jgi:hypothetical protein